MLWTLPTGFTWVPSPLEVIFVATWATPRGARRTTPVRSNPPTTSHRMPMRSRKCRFERITPKSSRRTRTTHYSLLPAARYILRAAIDDLCAAHRRRHRTRHVTLVVLRALRHNCIRFLLSLRRVDRIAAHLRHIRYDQSGRRIEQARLTRIGARDCGDDVGNGEIKNLPNAWSTECPNNARERSELRAGNAEKYQRDRVEGIGEIEGLDGTGIDVRGGENHQVPRALRSDVEVIVLATLEPSQAVIQGRIEDWINRVEVDRHVGLQIDLQDGRVRCGDSRGGRRQGHEVIHLHVGESERGYLCLVVRAGERSVGGIL